MNCHSVEINRITNLLKENFKKIILKDQKYMYSYSIKHDKTFQT